MEELADTLAGRRAQQHEAQELGRERIAGEEIRVQARTAGEHVFVGGGEDDCRELAAQLRAKQHADDLAAQRVPQQRARRSEREHERERVIDHVNAPGRGVFAAPLLHPRRLEHEKSRRACDPARHRVGIAGTGKRASERREMVTQGDAGIREPPERDRYRGSVVVRMLLKIGEQGTPSPQQRSHERPHLAEAPASRGRRIRRSRRWRLAETTRRTVAPKRGRDVGGGAVDPIYSDLSHAPESAQPRMQARCARERRLCLKHAHTLLDLHGRSASPRVGRRIIAPMPYVIPREPSRGSAAFVVSSRRRGSAPCAPFDRCAMPHRRPPSTSRRRVFDRCQFASV
jgi:hypothetical protein